MDSVVKNRLNSLKTELQDARDALNNQTQLLAERRADVDRLAAQVAILEEIHTAEEKQVGTATKAEKNGKLGPANSIVHLLRKKPGLEMVEVLDALEGKVNTAAKNQRHNLRTTLFNLEKSGKIIRSKDKKYSVPGD